MKNIKENSSKEKILNSAIKLFASNGFDGTSIRDICKDAGVNVCMISYYFGGKKELYQGILDDLIEKQTSFTKTFLDLNRSPEEYSLEEKKELLLEILDKVVDFFYSNISKDLIIILLKEQQNSNTMERSPALNYIRKLISSIFKNIYTEREIIFKTLFILSQINSPRILSGFSLRLLGQDDFIQEDIKIIKKNVKLYVESLFKEAGIA